MMIEFLSTYSYLVGSLYLLFVWLVLFLFVKRTNRTEMFFVSLSGVIFAFLLAPIYVLDWWSPTYFLSLDLFYGSFGLSDALFGWSLFGIASVAGELFIKSKEGPMRGTFLSLLPIGILIITFGFGLFSASVFLFHLNSLVATLLALGVLLCWMIYHRPQLARQAIRAAIVTTILALPAYFIPLAFRPTWITDEWLLDGFFSNIFVFGIPVEEFIWFSVTGAFLGIIWEFTRGIRYSET